MYISKLERKIERAKEREGGRETGRGSRMCAKGDDDGGGSDRIKTSDGNILSPGAVERARAHFQSSSSLAAAPLSLIVAASRNYCALEPLRRRTGEFHVTENISVSIIARGKNVTLGNALDGIW